VFRQGPTASATKLAEGEEALRAPRGHQCDTAAGEVPSNATYAFFQLAVPGNWGWWW